MKNIIIPLSIIFVMFSCQRKEPVKSNSINPVIGDISYLEKFGEVPNDESNEQERIQTHLEYVENLLRKKSTAHLSKEQKAKRNTLLNHLKDYALVGQFPINNDYPGERRPCFIDQNGNICAVGYLVEKSAGLEVANKINAKFQYATIHEMESDILNNWVDISGLSKNEVAMIQPTYGNPRDDEYIGYGYGIPSAALNVANIGFSAASLGNWNNPNYNKKYAKLGLASGLLTLGFNSFYSVATFRNSKTDYQKKVSNVNFLSSLATIGINSWRLVKFNKEKQKKKVSWNLNITPGINQEPVYGLAYTKRF